MRGTEAADQEREDITRITPACAGNRDPKPLLSIPKRDHPRVCGEQKGLKLKFHAPRGSPPRVRGTESGAGMTGQGNRITPACAGNSMNFFYTCNKFRDHPRVCGEQ